MKLVEIIYATAWGVVAMLLLAPSSPPAKEPKGYEQGDLGDRII